MCTVSSNKTADKQTVTLNGFNTWTSLTNRNDSLPLITQWFSFVALNREFKSSKLCARFVHFESFFIPIGNVCILSLIINAKWSIRLTSSLSNAFASIVAISTSEFAILRCTILKILRATLAHFRFWTKNKSHQNYALFFREWKHSRREATKFAQVKA